MLARSQTTMRIDRTAPGLVVGVPLSVRIVTVVILP